MGGGLDMNAFELGTDGPTLIIVAVDGSPTSLRAGAYAAGLARRQGARLLAVHVVHPPAAAALLPSAAAMVAQAGEEVAEDLRAQVAAAVTERGIEVDFLAVHGDPFTELARVAGEQRADAVVVGASTHTGHRLIGSLAVRLVRAGRWPVTVVP
jgi:nucleotide-binding universal stress UspA family protein